MSYHIGATTSSTFDGGTFTSDALKTDTKDLIVGSIISSAAGSLYIEQSSDGTNWDPTTSNAVLNYTANIGGTANAAIAVSANVSKGFSEQIILPYWRVKFVRTSGTGAPTTFKISARTSNSGVKY